MKQSTYRMVRRRATEAYLRRIEVQEKAMAICKWTKEGGHDDTAFP